MQVVTNVQKITTATFYKIEKKPVKRQDRGRVIKSHMWHC